MSYLTRLHNLATTQRERLRTDQVPNSEGGYVWEVDIWTRLRRFLILGSEAGSFYASERKLTIANTRALDACIEQDGARTVELIAEISEAGRAPKNDPAVYALARCASAADVITRRAALAALPRVCRTGTHLFQFATIVNEQRGWGRALRRAVGAWYAARDADAIAYQAVKYRQREGFTHRDVLRLAHPARLVSAGNPTLDISTEQARLFEWVVRGGDADGLPRIVEGYTRAQRAGSAKEAARLVREYQLPREALPSEHLASPAVWEALLETMPMTAMIRNLATMTRVGLLTPGSPSVGLISERLSDGARIRKARVHPIALLVAARTYASGRGCARPQLLDAGDRHRRRARRGLLPRVRERPADWQAAAARARRVGVDDLRLDRGHAGAHAADASAAMALVTRGRSSDTSRWSASTPAAAAGCRSGTVPGARRRPHAAPAVCAAAAGRRGPPRLRPAVRRHRLCPADAYALERGRAVDTFVVYTDSETWAGDMHPAEALRRYRQSTGIAARLVVVGMVANRFTIADPNDAGMLDVVGFDTSTPQVIGGFSRGEL